MTIERPSRRLPSAPAHARIRADPIPAAPTRPRAISAHCRSGPGRTVHGCHHRRPPGARLFPIRATGISTRPLLEAAEAFIVSLEALSPGQQDLALALLRESLSLDGSIHTVVRTPNGNDYGRDLLRQHHEQLDHARPGHAHR